MNESPRIRITDVRPRGPAIETEAQGSQYESGIALEEPIARTEEDRRRWLYTVYTRFAKRVIGAA